MRALLARAERTDATEDAQHGRDRRGDALPAGLARRTTRLQTNRTAMAALEAELRARYFSTEDQKKGMGCFLEERKPDVKAKGETAP